jgi:hypothetical protein
MADPIDKYLAELGQRLVNELTAKLDQKGKVASGNLRQSIGYKVVRNGDELAFQITADEYYQQVDKGRGKSTKKGDKPLSAIIYEWIIRKGIPVGELTRAGAAKKFGGRKRLRSLIENRRRGMAFAIARKIHKRGYKGSNFWSEVVNEELLTQVEKEIALLFRVQIQATLTDGNNNTSAA